MENGGVLRAGSGPGLPWKRLIAEFVAITAGVYLGLLADDYRDFRKDRVSEQEYLRLLAEDLDRDYENIVALRKAIEKQSVGAQLINGSPDNAEISVNSAELALTGLFFTSTYEAQRTTYLGLRDSAQLQLISSPSLRSSLTSYFEVRQPYLLVSITELLQSQQRVRVRAGRYVRIFPPERFDTLRLSPDGPIVTKLLVPISQIREDVELMNDIAEVGARGFQMTSWMKQIEEQNKDLRDNLSKQMD
jgi:hypothetical protein